MNTSLEHIPPDKQAQLKKVVDIIVETAQPEKIILFGSYARGKWIDERHMEGSILHEYVSDYDILVITKRGDKRQDFEVQEMVEARCNFHTPVTVIVHSIDYVNARLSEGQYFFSDIKKEGILLYDAGNIPLAERKELSPEEVKLLAQQNFDKWYPSSVKFFKYANYAFKDLLAENEKLNEAAFLLHQAAERTFNAAILVFTGYKPRTHNLGKLIRLSKDFSPELAGVFPYNTEQEKNLFNLLKRAYIDARYKDNYVIVQNELEILIEKVGKLQDIAGSICKAKIASFS